MNARACLLVLPDGAASVSDAVLEVTRSAGLDPKRLRIQLNGRALAAAARGSGRIRSRWSTRVPLSRALAPPLRRELWRAAAADRLAARVSVAAT